MSPAPSPSSSSTSGDAAPKVPRSVITDVLLFPLVIVPTIILIVVVAMSLPFIFVSDIRAARRFRREYRARGRLISRKELDRHIIAGEGTLLFDGETNRLFWTPDRVLRMGPRPAVRVFPHSGNVANRAFVEWCRPRYLDKETGTAFAVAVPRSISLARNNEYWKTRSASDSVIISESMFDMDECAACRNLYPPKDHATCPICSGEQEY